MKTKLAVLVSSLLIAVLRMHGAVLTAATPVYAQPDLKAPVLSVLNAGSTPTPTANTSIVAPVGWIAVDVQGPFDAYLHGRELNKNLDIRPDAPLYLHPKADAPILTHYTKGMKVDITGIRGKWMQVKLNQPLVGYVQVGVTDLSGPGASAAVPAVTPAPAPMPATAPAATATGTDSPDSLPRYFQGKFVSSRRPFAPRRPFDYQLNDSAGVRFAYLDLSKLMVTQVLEQYVDQDVVVFGVAQKMKNANDIVIKVESLHIR